MSSKQIGDFGEKIAREYLEKKGYKILDRNYFFIIAGNPKAGEMDIVAKKDGVIVFAEVKTLKDSAFFPEDKVDFAKQKKIIKTAESWLLKNKIPLNVKWQIDIIAVRLTSEGKAKISHFENAVSDY